MKNNENDSNRYSSIPTVNGVKNSSYFGGIFHGMFTLLTGMKVTLIEFFKKKVTEEFPENRDKLVLTGRFRGRLYMPVDETGHNKCIACGLCESNCPNGTLHLQIESVTDDRTGKKKKILNKYQYDLGSCMFCQLCVNVCPTAAIAFNTEFEHAVFNKEKLVKILNKEDSYLTSLSSNN